MKASKFIALGLLMISVSLAGCSKKGDIKPEEGMDGGTGEGVSEGAIDSGRADSDSNNAMGLQTVYFPYDSFDIVGENREALKNNIAIMKENSSVNVQIEGHCDERGGIQYNLALGEKRANAIAQQMAAAGISKARIATITMGKEKPLVMGSDESSWSKNRRGNFVITSK